MAVTLPCLKAINTKRVRFVEKRRVGIFGTTLSAVSSDVVRCALHEKKKNKLIIGSARW